MRMDCDTRSCSYRAVMLFVFIIVMGSLNSVPVSTSEKAIDLMVVLDLSGSMKSQAGAGRYDSLFEWIDAFLHADDRIGVVAMGHGARLLIPLTSKSVFSFDDLKPSLGKREKYTDVAAGMESAFYQLNTASTRDRQRLILLYSDAEIDMPGGEWDVRNATRYLLMSLKPAMKEQQIRFAAIVPEGQKANFQLLQELSSDTGGVYSRGVPRDASAVRAKTTGPLVVLSNDPSRQKTASNAGDTMPPSTAQHPPHASPVPSRQSTRADSEKKEAAALGPPVVIEKTPIWLVPLFALIGAGLIGMFVTMIILFRRHKGESDDMSELNRLLDDVHSLKQITARRRLSSISGPIADDVDETNTFDSDETQANISVGLVSSYLDSIDEGADEYPALTDELSSNPIVSSGESSPLSISTMEALIGTLPSDAEEQN